MKVCIIGNGLISLSLACVLIRKDIHVDILSSGRDIEYDKTRTLGISKSNVDYFNKEIADIKKILWKINNIKIYTENSNDKEVVNFSNDGQQIFSIVKNYQLYEILKKKLSKNKNIKFDLSMSYKNILKKKYDLIINCDSKHEISNKFFSRRIEKNYNSNAYITVITHKSTEKNNTAVQNFTNKGPIAFLPISKTKTSVVYSLRNDNKNNKIDIKDLIKKYNPNYSITKVNELTKFSLNSSNLRKYFYKNILAFGDMLHKIHPLAGQGFNMTLRDIQLLSEIIDKRINLGLNVDSSICVEFQKKIKDKNFIFSMGIDLIYEIFNFESKVNSKLISKSINMVSRNVSINSFFKNFADKGLRI